MLADGCPCQHFPVPATERAKFSIAYSTYSEIRHRDAGFSDMYAAFCVSRMRTSELCTTADRAWLGIFISTALKKQIIWHQEVGFKSSTKYHGSLIKILSDSNPANWKQQPWKILAKCWHGA